MSVRHATAWPLSCALWVLLACAKRPPVPIAPPRDVATSSSSASTAPSEVGPLVRLGYIGDRVAAIDAPIHPDGITDFAFRVRISGDVVAMALIGSDGHGNPVGAIEWDTYAGATPIPKALGVPFQKGVDTAELGVFDASGKLLNPEATLAPRTFHDEFVTLYAADVWGYFHEGRAFALLVVRPDGRVDKSTVLLF